MTPSEVPLTSLTDELAVAARRLADRSRRWPSSVWRRRTPSGSVADEMHRVVLLLAATSQLVEAGPDAEPAPARVPARPPYDAALSDQLAVLAHDLVTALRAAHPGEVYAGRAVEELAAEALEALADVVRAAS